MKCRQRRIAVRPDRWSHPAYACACNSETLPPAGGADSRAGRKGAPRLLAHRDAQYPPGLSALRHRSIRALALRAQRAGEAFAADCLRPIGTCEILQEAARHLHCEEAVQIVCDGGTENFNAAVDAVVAQLEWERIRALVDLTFSNSKIEAWCEASSTSNSTSTSSTRSRMSADSPSSTWSSTTASCSTRRSMGRRPTRCTTVLVRSWGKNLRPNARTLAEGDSRRTDVRQVPPRGQDVPSARPRNFS